MKWYPFVCAVALAAPLVAQEKAASEQSAVTGGAIRPPVLRGAEQSDSIILVLPGPPPPPTIVPVTPPPAPVPPAEDDADDHRPLLRRSPKPVLPAEFEHDSAIFAQKWIGLWSEPDAYNLFGEPLRERTVVDESQSENGRIYAFPDPTGRYREIELDFAKGDGLLRTVFVYPWKLKWDECQRQWGSNVRSTEANKGRTFHSYLNRRLDVLVDRGGNVISFGLY
jgi:hypothetical protein